MSAVLGIVGIGARVDVHETVFQGPIDQDRQLFRAVAVIANAVGGSFQP